MSQISTYTIPSSWPMQKTSVIPSHSRSVQSVSILGEPRRSTEIIRKNAQVSGQTYTGILCRGAELSGKDGFIRSGGCTKDYS